MKQQPCPNSATGKHAWKFVKNGMKTTMTRGPLGSVGHAKLVGIYQCACGAKKTGTPNHSAPGNDLREHLK